MGLSNNLSNNLGNKLAATMPFHAFHAITTPVAVLGKLGTATPQLRRGVIAELGTSHMGSLSHAFLHNFLYFFYNFFVPWA